MKHCQHEHCYAMKHVGNNLLSPSLPIVCFSLYVQYSWSRLVALQRIVCTWFACCVLIDKNSKSALLAPSAHNFEAKGFAHLADWTVGLEEVWLQVGIEQVTSDAFNSVIDGQDMHPLAVLDISALQSA